MITVSNSSPLILYATIDRLDQLWNLFSEIVIPPRVWHEVVVEGAHRPGAPTLSRASELRQREPENVSVIEDLMRDLDPGEAHAIALCAEIRPPKRLLLDDRKARRIALAHDLPVLGSAGILVAAKERSLIAHVGPLLAELQSAGLYLSDAIANKRLARVGEPMTFEESRSVDTSTNILE